MSAKNLSELLIEELRDAYDGEKRLTRALPKMAKAASSEELSAAFMTHLRETEGQIVRLEQVFKILGEAPRGKKCEGIMGIVEEGEQAMQELDGPVLDAALIAGAQKVEHYEIASVRHRGVFRGAARGDARQGPPRADTGGGEGGRREADHARRVARESGSAARRWKRGRSDVPGGRSRPFAAPPIAKVDRPQFPLEP